MTTLDPGPHVDAIIGLAEEIARPSPECAEKAFKIVEFARELSDSQPDRSSIQEAIESEMLDDEVSDSRSRSITAAVMATMMPIEDEEEKP
jgi:hypothetical protein